jgi:YVTN family beta-propeller protein
MAVVCCEFPFIRKIKMKRICLLAGVASAVLAFSAAAAPFAYVPNEESGTISVIDTATDEVVKEIRAGDKPRGLAVSRDGKKLYVSDQPHNSLVVIDLEKLEPVDSIYLENLRKGWYFSRWKVGVAAVEVSNAIAFINTETNKKEFLVKVKGENPEHAVFSPDGKWVYSSAEEAHQIDVIDVKQRKQVSQIEVGKRPRGIAFTPDGKTAYTAAEFVSTIYALDVTKQTVSAVIPGGQFSNGVAVHPDGSRVFVSNGKDGTVSVIDIATNKIITTIAVGKRPWNMAMTPDGGKLYVANGRSDSVSVIDTATNTKIKDIAVGKRPWGVVIR